MHLSSQLTCSAAFNPQTTVLGEMREALALARDDPDLDSKVVRIRADINQWVAKYRRNTKYGGRPSYG